MVCPWIASENGNVRGVKWLLSLQAWGRDTGVGQWKTKKALVLKHGCLCLEDNFWPQGLNFTPLGEVTWTRSGQTCWKDTLRKTEWRKVQFFFYLVQRNISSHTIAAIWWTGPKGELLYVCICVCDCDYVFMCVCLLDTWVFRGLLSGMCERAWNDPPKKPKAMLDMTNRDETQRGTCSVPQRSCLYSTSLIVGVMLLCSVAVFVPCIWRACMCVCWCKWILIIDASSFSTLWLSGRVWQTQLRGCQWVSWMCARQEDKASKGPCLTHSIALISFPRSRSLLPSLSLAIQASSLFTPLWLMSLVRCRPLPLTPIKTLGLSTWLPALKQTAGLQGPSSLSLSAGVESLAQSVSCWPSGSDACPHWGGQTEGPSWTGPVSLLQWNPAQKNWAIKAKCQTIPVWQTVLHRDLLLLSVHLPAGRHCRTPLGLNQSLNWIDH